MGVTNREIIEDLGFVVENQTNLNIDNVKLLTRKKNVKTKYTFYKLFTNRLAILLFSILMIFFAFNIYPEFTFIDDRNDLMIDPIINTESFKKYYEEEIHDNSVILNADTKTFTDIESGNEYEINRNILEGYVWDYVSGNIPLMIFIIILPVLITSIITKKFALVRIFILSMLSIYYCLLINTIIICDDIEITYHIRWYVEHNKKGAIIFFIILYLISVIALIIQRAKYSKDATVVKEYKKMNSKDTIATKYLNILKKYNVLLSKDTEFNRAETNANLVTQMDKMYNYPLPNFTQNDIDIRTYINTSGIRSIIDKQSHEVITYLNDISNRKWQRRILLIITGNIDPELPFPIHTIFFLHFFICILAGFVIIQPTYSRDIEIHVITVYIFVTATIIPWSTQHIFRQVFPVPFRY